MSISDRARLMFFSLLSYSREAQSHGLNQILLIRLFYKPALLKSNLSGEVLGDESTGGCL